LVMKECIKPGLKVQWRGMRCLLEYKRMKIGWMIAKDILFGNGEGIELARNEGPAIEYALYLLCPCVEGLEKGEEKGKKVR
jgi:hypothetical protein